MANFLVTGGCGFIGSHLVDALLKEGHGVQVLDDLSTGKKENISPQANLIVGDVGDKEVVREAMTRVDGCFHLAAISSVEKSVQDWAGTHLTNLTGAINIFEAASRRSNGSPTPVVYASSAAVYGDNASMPLKEDAALRPLTAYGADKLGCELHARVAGIIHQVPTTGFRFFNVYGPRQDPNSPYSGVISIFAERILSGKSVTIFGDGQQIRDFVFVSDIVAFLLAGMENTSTNAPVYNACTGKGTDIIQLARTLSVIGGATEKIQFAPARSGDIRVSLGDPLNAQEKLEVTSAVPLAVGLRETVEYITSSTSIAA